MSIHGSYEERYTLAQFARRVGISEGRARAMFAEGDRLPRPDAFDAGGRPMWRESSVDSWCRRVGRPVPKEARGLATWEDAREPAPVMYSGEVLVPSWRQSPSRVHVIIWDTPNGHLAQVNRFDLERVDNRDAAAAVAHLLEPAFWPDAIVIVPPTGTFGAEEYDLYNIDAYRLRPPDQADPVRGRRLLNLLKAPAGDQSGPPDPRDVAVEVAGLHVPAEIERVIGRPMPMWVDGSCTPEAARRLVAFGYGTTFTVPDTTTQWPQTRENLTAAFQWGMAERFPQAFAALARDARATLDDTQRQHARQGERGEGWYLVARPARPDWPVTLEQAATEAAGHEPDLDAAAAELEQLRPLEAQETYPGPLGEALFEATRELGWLLHQQRPELVFNATVRQVIISAGPVVEQWRETLTPVSAAEQGQLTNSRRLARLLSSDISPQVEAEFHFVDNSRNQVNAMWRDHADRLVVELDEKAWNDELLLAMEWPTDLPDGWDDHTVIAGDAHADAVFALTSTKDGRLRADPLPNPAADPSYTWGYSGTGPSNLYDALVRCALGLWPSNSPGDWLNRPAPTGSELWAFITGTAKDGPIRLPWPQVQAWARADRKRAMRPT